MPKQSEDGTPKPLDHIEQIRDIIFGPQKREYDDRFSQFTAELKRTKNEMVARNDDLRAQFQKEITAGLAALDQSLRQLTEKMEAETTGLRQRMQDENQALQQRIQSENDSLRQKMAADNATLQQLLETTEKKLNAELASLVQKVDESNATLRKELNDVRARLQSELHAARDEAARNLESESTRLRESKVSRDVMAEMLHEVAMKLEGVEMLAELQRAARKKSAE